MDKKLILLSEYIENSRIEVDFILRLESEGLIETEVHGDDRYIQASCLSDLELFKRLHYELFVNIEGIDIINNLLNKIRSMERELSVLRREHDSGGIVFESIFDEDDL